MSISLRLATIVAVLAVSGTAGAQTPRWSGTVLPLEAPVLLRLAETPKTQFRKITDTKIETLGQSAHFITTLSGTTLIARESGQFVNEIVLRVDEELNGKPTKSLLSTEAKLRLLLNDRARIEKIEISHPSIKPASAEAKFVSEFMQKQVRAAMPEHFPVHPVVQGDAIGEIDFARMSVPGWIAEGRVSPRLQGTAMFNGRPVLVAKFTTKLTMKSDHTVERQWQASGVITGLHLIDRRNGSYVYTETRGRLSGSYSNGGYLKIASDEWMSILE